jgi:RimJ/RimL family protein N-acetyltransferase
MILIETQRLQMREFTLEDIDEVYAFTSHADVSRYTGDAGRVKSRDDAAAIIKDIWMADYAQYGYGRYALIHKADKKVIGFCGVKFDQTSNGTDLGYRLLPEYWGQGLAFEAATAMMDYAQKALGLTRILADAVDENLASNKILVKLGFNKVKSVTEQGVTSHYYESTIAS